MAALAFKLQFLVKTFHQIASWYGFRTTECRHVVFLLQVL